MFEALKKKLASWLGKPEEKKEKKDKKTKKTLKVEKKSKIISKIKKEIEKNEKSGKQIIPEIKEEKIEKRLQVEQETEEKLEKREEPIKTSASQQIESIDISSPEKPKTNFFSKLFGKLQTTKITKENFEEIFEELETILLENNVALEVVDKIKEDLEMLLIGKEVNRKEIERIITNSLKESILHLLIEPPILVQEIEEKSQSPFVILFFGINGSGKTTSIAKLAYKLKKQNISVIMAAADTFRAASIEQLKTHGEKLQIPVIAKEYGSDPAAVAFDAISYAKTHNIKVVLIDTAGRMYTKQNLMKEMEKIVRISKPDLKFFVGESITGNDAVEQAKMFNETAGIDGIILSKADVDEKAGTILSVSHVTNKPIYYLGIGQDYPDLQDFRKANVLAHLGLG